MARKSNIGILGAGIIVFWGWGLGAEKAVGGQRSAFSGDQGPGTGGRGINSGGWGLGTGGWGQKKKTDALIDSLKNPDPLVREKAAEALGKAGSSAKQVIEALVGRFADHDPYVQGKAADALASIGKSSIPVLIEALKDTSDNVRWCAAIALGKIGKQAVESVPSLREALHDRNENVRWCSAIALGEIGPKAGETVPALKQCLFDRDQDVRWAAGLALDRIDPGVRQKRPDLPEAVSLIDSLVPSLMEELHVPGVSIALVSDRSPAWSKSYGIADVRKGNPVIRETLFEAASMTKPVFAHTVLKLAEQGKLDLDRPLVDYLDKKAVPDQPERRHITARMILSHTTGFPNWRMGEEERDGPLPVLFMPGSRFGYSGEGMFALQRVVEHILSEPIQTYARRTLFNPLGMKHTSYVWNINIDTLLAAGHDAEGVYLQKTRYTHANAAYTLYTTAEEYALFLIEIMKTDRSAAHSLSRRSIETMLSHQVKVDVREPIERPGRAKGNDVFWGLGWSINTTGEGDIIHHSGSNRSGFRCFSQFSPSRGSGIVIMTNSTNGGDLWTRVICAVGDF